MDKRGLKNRIKHMTVMTAVMILIVIAAAAAELMLAVDRSYAAEGYEDVASSSEMASALTVGKYGMVPIHESDVKPGTYHVTTDSSSSFFHIVDTKLTVKKDKMVAVIQIASYSYKCVYMGTGEEAAKAELKDYIMAEESDLGTSFTIPIEALNKEIPLAAFSKKKKKWYDRLILVDASTLPASAVSFTVPDYSRIESAIELYDQENKTNTREELDAWLRGENRFAKEFGIMFPRKELKSKSLIKRMLTNEHVARNVDMDGINWLLYRPAEKTA